MQLDTKHNNSDMAGLLNRVLYNFRNFRFHARCDWRLRGVSQSL